MKLDIDIVYMAHIINVNIVSTIYVHHHPFSSYNQQQQTRRKKSRQVFIFFSFIRILNFMPFHSFFIVVVVVVDFYSTQFSFKLKTLYNTMVSKANSFIFFLSFTLVEYHWFSGSSWDHKLCSNLNLILLCIIFYMITIAFFRFFDLSCRHTYTHTHRQHMNIQHIHLEYFMMRKMNILHTYVCVCCRTILLSGQNDWTDLIEMIIIQW